MKKNNIIYTIEELYLWAKKNGVEDYTVFVFDEGGCAGNLYVDEFIVKKEEEEITL